MGALFGVADGRQRLILIDELFRGTNSIERVAAAQAVLAELDRGDDIVVVATHDVELLELLPTYISFHFREEVQDGLLTFDYSFIQARALYGTHLPSSSWRGTRQRSWRRPGERLRRSRSGSGSSANDGAR